MGLKFVFRWGPFFTLLLLLLSACRSTKGGTQQISPQKSLERSIEHSTTFNGLTGFMLMDQATGEIIYEKNADTYFTPASNAKILTLLTAMKVLESENTALQYSKTEEGEIYVQGTGHPALLNPAFHSTDSIEEDNTILAYLQKQGEDIVFCDCNFQDEKYGSGWSWDDFHYYFQSEKSPLPLYGNNVIFSKAAKSEDIQSMPSFFESSTTIDSDSSNQRTSILRNWDSNNFAISIPLNSSITNKVRPFRADKTTIVQLLSDTLHRDIKFCDNACTKREYKPIKSPVASSKLFKQLMYNSDNFVAEQLLLLCSDQLFDTLNVKRTINWAQDSLFSFLDQQPRWVDGSGLSRYNMITPRNLVAVLNQLYLEHPENELFELFPTGGQSGTIKDWYGGLEKPYVFAKTGSLRHIHCLSGYVITKKGRRLVFSFMNNNYMGSIRELKREMEKVLQLIYVEL